MKIGIILHPYGEEKPGGLARTIFEWTNGLLRSDQENEYFLFTKGMPQSHSQFFGHRWKPIPLKSGLFWLDRLRKITRMDVYIFQTPVLPLFFTPKRSIVIVQDFPYKYLTPKSVCEWIKNILLAFYHRVSLQRASVIIAVSKSTKDDIIKFFNIPQEKVHVVPMGFKRICQEKEIEIKVPERFFLFVGVIKERKNIFTVLRAFQQFLELHKGTEYKLVLAGKNGGSYFEEVKKFIFQNELGHCVDILGYLNDGQLSYVYRRAQALIFPSLVEGFGFPVLEAMDCGLPVITSNMFGPAELGKDSAAILVNPYSKEEIMHAFECITFDDKKRQELIHAGRKRARMYSWDKAARELLKVIRS